LLMRLARGGGQDVQTEGGGVSDAATLAGDGDGMSANADMAGDGDVHRGTARAGDGSWAKGDGHTGGLA